MVWIPRDIKDLVVPYPTRYKVNGVQTMIEPDFGAPTQVGTKVNKEYLQPIEDQLKENQDAITTAQATANSKAPINHASEDATYGPGNAAQYGHLKLSDSIDLSSGAAAGIAATPTAIKTAYDLANTAKTQATYYGTCATAAATTAKAVVSSGFVLVTGVRIAVYFTYANTATTPTLNVNSTGAKTIARLSNWEAGATIIFAYDGTYWRQVESISQKTYYGTCATAAATTAKVGTVPGFILSAGAVVGLKFTYSNTATSPTLNVNSTGALPIYYADTYILANMITVGMTAFFQYNGTQWMLLNPSYSVSPVFGTYAGNGSESRFISLGFTPSALAIWDNTGRQGDQSALAAGTTWGGLALPGYPCRAYGKTSSTETSTIAFEISASGFTVYSRTISTTPSSEVALNNSNYTYYYMAFR